MGKQPLYPHVPKGKKSPENEPYTCADCGRWYVGEPHTDKVGAKLCNYCATKGQKPREPNVLPVFKGFTVDYRLREFRKMELGKLPKFIPFNSSEGIRMLNEYEGGPTKRMLPSTKRPTRSQVKVTVWEERDRLHIGIVDKATEQISYADWWDDDARQMFEDGFFEGAIPRDWSPTNNAWEQKFKNSVLRYAEDMGILSK